MQYYQQGDVLLKRIDRLPEGLIKLKGAILQEGETTGHKHQFIAINEVQLYTTGRTTNERTITTNEQKYLIVNNVVELLHEEHKPIIVEPGIYEIDIVREYDYDANEVRRVVD